MKNFLKNIETYIVYLVIVLLPSFTLSVFPSAQAFPKMTLLVFAVVLIGFLKTINLIINGGAKIKTGQFDFIVFLFLLSYLVSTIVQSPSKMEALSFPGTATIIIFSPIFYFFVNQVKEKANIKLSLFVSGILLSLFILLGAAGIFQRISGLPSYLTSPSFNPMGGSSLPSTMYLIALLPLALNLLLKEKEMAKKVFLGVSSLILIIGLGISVSNVLPGKDTAPVLLDFNSSWQIAAGAIKESPLLGSGPGNYLVALNRFRPITYNQMDFWANKFISSRSFYLTILTEVGLLGVAATVLLFVSLYRKLKEKEFKIMESLSLLSLLLLSIAFVFYPAGITLTLLFFVLLSLNNKPGEVQLNLSSQSQKFSLWNRIPALLVALPLFAFLSLFSYSAGRAVLAEATYKKALDALALNDGLSVYEFMRQTLTLNPSDIRYHTAHSQVNLALARTISREAEVSDQDRQVITQLINQAINEAKAAVTLNPQKAVSWEVLARTYQSIIAFSQGADVFALQSFRQAIALDPLNPNLRINLGGLYYALGNYDRAIDSFELAVLSKPDLANAHYNLATALREKGQIEAAIQQMTVVLSLVEKDSQDFQLATSVLEDLEARRPIQEGQGTENLVPPPTAEEPAIKPPINLPAEAAPPEVEEVAPTPTP